MTADRYQVPDQRGRFAIITGANGGLGYEIARRLSGAGATVMLAVRDGRKGEAARRSIKAEHPAAQVMVEELDVVDLAAIARFAEARRSDERPIDLLIHSAGIMAVPTRQTTRDGFEVQLATNYLGPFALTGRLFPLLRAANGARMVTISSLAGSAGSIDLDDLQSERSYKRWRAYSLSKLADLMFAREFDRRSREAGWSVRAVSAHPGVARTGMTTTNPNIQSSSWQDRIVRLQVKIPGMSQPASRAVEPILFAATSPSVIGGGYYGPVGWMELRGRPGPVKVPKQAHDDAVAARLWEVSEELTGVRYPS